MELKDANPMVVINNLNLVDFWDFKNCENWVLK
jgi:hypothetical protein